MICILLKKTIIRGVRKKCPQERNSPENCPQENCPRKTTPEKLFDYSFVVIDVVLHLFNFKLFIITSFRGVSSSPAASIMDPLVTQLQWIPLWNKL